MDLEEVVKMVKQLEERVESLEDEQRKVKQGNKKIFSDEDLYTLYKDGLSAIEIADKLKVGRSAVYQRLGKLSGEDGKKLTFSLRKGSKG